MVLHETTGRAFSLMEARPPGQQSQAPASYPYWAEGFYVLEGSIDFIARGEGRKGCPGFWAVASGGVSHAHSAMEEAAAYFAELKALWTPTPEEERGLMRRPGLETQ